MEFSEYQKLAMRTDDPKKYNGGINRLINGLMGLNGEAGEAIDILKKALFQGHELKKDELVEELGDVLWYLALISDTIGLSLEDIANNNILKLVKRYPEGFSEKQSLEREENETQEAPLEPDGYSEERERPVPGPEAMEAMNDSYGEPVVPEMRNES